MPWILLLVACFTAPASDCTCTRTPGDAGDYDVTVCSRDHAQELAEAQCANADTADEDVQCSCACDAAAEGCPTY